MRSIPGLHHPAPALLSVFHRATEYELLAHDAHCLHHGGADNRFTAFADQSLNEFCWSLFQAGGHTNHLPGQHQTPCRGIHQPGFRLPLMGAPVAGTDLLGNQFVARLGVRHTQQGFGQTHQREAFRIGQAELLQEAFHHAFVTAAGARCLNQFERPTHRRLSQIV